MTGVSLCTRSTKKKAGRLETTGQEDNNQQELPPGGDASTGRHEQPHQSNSRGVGHVVEDGTRSQQSRYDCACAEASSPSTINYLNEVDCRNWHVPVVLVLPIRSPDPPTCGSRPDSPFIQSEALHVQWDGRGSSGPTTVAGCRGHLTFQTRQRNRHLPRIQAAADQ